MSIDNSFERIATALEIIALAVNGEVRAKAESATEASADQQVAEGEVAASGGPKVTRKGTSKKKGAAKKGAAKAKKEDGPTREDVHDALTDFCKDGPGKAAAKDVLEEFKAGSISTLDVESYGAFIARLIEVSGG